MKLKLCAELARTACGRRDKPPKRSCSLASLEVESFKAGLMLAVVERQCLLLIKNAFIVCKLFFYDVRTFFIRFSLTENDEVIFHQVKHFLPGMGNAKNVFEKDRL